MPTRNNPQYPHHPPEIVPPKNRGRNENQEQRIWRDALNKLGIGHFTRHKTMGTFDPAKGIFRRDKSADIGFPDISGYLKPLGRAVFIECKHIDKVEKKRSLVFKAKITQEQKDFLLAAHKAGCIAGIAFTLDDAIAIAVDDPSKYLRHPRTYQFLPDAEQEEYANKYAEKKRALAKLNQDPLARDIFSHTPKEEEWEKL